MVNEVPGCEVDGIDERAADWLRRRAAATMGTRPWLPAVATTDSGSTRSTPMSSRSKCDDASAPVSPAPSLDKHRPNQEPSDGGGAGQLAVLGHRRRHGLRHGRRPRHGTERPTATAPVRSVESGIRRPGSRATASGTSGNLGARFPPPAHRSLDRGRGQLVENALGFDCDCHWAPGRRIARPLQTAPTPSEAWNWIDAPLPTHRRPRPGAVPRCTLLTARLPPYD